MQAWRLGQAGRPCGWHTRSSSPPSVRLGQHRAGALYWEGCLSGCRKSCERAWAGSACSSAEGRGRHHVSSESTPCRVAPLLGRGLLRTFDYVCCGWLLMEERRARAVAGRCTGGACALPGTNQRAGREGSDAKCSASRVKCRRRGKRERSVRGARGIAWDRGDPMDGWEAEAARESPGRRRARLCEMAGMM